MIMRTMGWRFWFFSHKTGAVSTLVDFQAMMLLGPEGPACNRYSGMSASPLSIPAGCVAGETPPPGTLIWLECSLLSCSGLGGRSPLCVSLSHCCAQTDFLWMSVFLSVRWGSGYVPQFPQLFHEGSVRHRREGCGPARRWDGAPPRSGRLLVASPAWHHCPWIWCLGWQVSGGTLPCLPLRQAPSPLAPRQWEARRQLLFLSPLSVSLERRFTVCVGCGNNIITSPQGALSNQPGRNHPG